MSEDNIIIITEETARKLAMNMLNTGAPPEMMEILEDKTVALKVDDQVYKLLTALSIQSNVSIDTVILNQLIIDEREE